MDLCFLLFFLFCASVTSWSCTALVSSLYVNLLSLWSAMFRIIFTLQNKWHQSSHLTCQEKLDANYATIQVFENKVHSFTFIKYQHKIKMIKVIAARSGSMSS